MRKHIVYAVTMLILIGCEKEMVINDFKTRCVNGVEYYVMSPQAPYKARGFMAVKLNRKGEVILCDE